MLNEDRAALEAAYRKTRYLVRLDAGDLELRIDRPDPAADDRLRREVGCQREWALVTPCNPRSGRLSDVVNARLYEEMRQELTMRGQRFVSAVHHDPDGSWPDEASFLLIDPPPHVPETLGRDYKQNAIVTGTLGSPPLLRWNEER